MACFECPEDLSTRRMETIAWTPTREEIRSLSVSPQGVIAAAGDTQSVTLYTCTAEDGFQVLCADPHRRSTVSCLAGPSQPQPEGLQVCTNAFPCSALPAFTDLLALSHSFVKERKP